ncbi:MAG: sensor histidine kinase [Cytophagia bacterium]|nr:sensor histidine kinase [Cytophagia bacterium]
MKYHLFVLLISLLSVLGSFQEPDLQSYLQKAEQYQFDQPDSSLHYALLLKEKALESNDSIYLGESQRVIGVYFQLKGRLDSAGKYYERSLNYYQGTQDTVRLTRIILSLALVDISKGQYDKALNSLLTAQKYAESVGREDYRLRSIGEVARIYSLQGDHENAIEQARYFYSQVKDGDDIRQKSIALSYLSVEFMHFKDYDSSLFYLNKNLVLEENNPVVNPTALGAIHQNIASVYTELKVQDKSLENFQKALSYYERAGYLIGIAQVSLNIATELTTESKFQEAKNYIQSALQGAQYLGDLHLLREMYRLESEILQKLDDYKGSLQSFTNYKKMNDSIFNIEKQSSINELLTQYEVGQKEQQIEVQQAELLAQEARIQRNQIFILALFIIVFLVVLLFYLWKNRTEKAHRLERQEAQLKLREAEINAIINSQEKERNRFARDLHDGFGQLISVLKLNLDQLSKFSAKDGDKRMEVFKNGESVINEMYSELRNICFDLMPQTLVKRGLTPALKELGAKLSSTDQLNCEVLIFNNSPRLKELYEISLFRITQEWVNNILKYAEADNITIQLLKDPEELTLTVEDNGNGFDPRTFYEGAGNGWKNIQTRLKLINADFDLDSRTGIKGTMMTVNVPMNKEHFIPTGTEEKLTN